MKKSILLIFLLYVTVTGFGQAREYLQTIRGQVSDAESKAPLPGASIVLSGSNPIIGTSTDGNGYFALEHVPIGRVSLDISFIGYNPATISNLNVTSGKEVILNITLEEKITMKDEVVISADQDKTNPINTMATVSAREFSVEESQRYAGSRNDVSRMAANFAGASSYNDAVNDIVIRGNSSDGLLWRLEGIPIPNPNHFGQLGATGGPVSMLNNNVLANSDFLTGAFPAEYGGAISGVFDLKFRPGNYQKHEFLGQLGFNGFELGAEGPISRKNNSSYIVNYRYSTMGVMSALGIQFGTGTSIPYYQDLSFNFNIPVNQKSRIEVFGLGGLNHITFMSSSQNDAQDDENLYGTDNLDIYAKGGMGVAGISYTYLVDPSAYFRVTLAGTYFYSGSEVDTVIRETGQVLPNSSSSNHKYDYILDACYNKKFSARDRIRTGLNIDRIDFNLVDSSYYPSLGSFEINYDSKGHTFLYQLYAEWQHHFSESLEMNAGLHFQALALNNNFSVEPRLGFKWTFRPRQSLSLAYGLHSRPQQPFIYFTRIEVAPGVFEDVNKDIGFTRANHIVAGYDFNFSGSFRLKVESYYQYLFDVPVETSPSSFSMLNISSMQPLSYDTLVNSGKGRNYGLELTLEKFLTKGYYFLLTASLYDSKYKGSDGVLRPTAFDSKYIVNLLGGYEIRLNGRHPEAKFKTWLCVDGKITSAGGLRYTPVDHEASYQAGYTIYDDGEAFSKQFRDYFRMDVKVTYRLDSKRVSQELSVDIQNITNRQNPIYMQYNPTTQQEEFMYQLGFFPMMQYRIIF
jgi:hypothetical protein